MKRKIFLTLALLTLFANVLFAVDVAGQMEILAPGLQFKDSYTIRSDKNFFTDYDPLNLDGTLNAVIEIPAGTNAKWEVDSKTGILSWEIKDGKPRMVKYLGYPGNYGMVPRVG